MRENSLPITATIDNSAVTQSQLSIKTMLAVCIGNALEWYDFMIYNYMLLFIAQAFFPSHNRTTSLLATMASSGVAFVVRPYGGLLLSYWADRKGHQHALMLVFYFMAAAMLMMILTPAYASIGIAATLLILLARALQGIAAGGEFSIASTIIYSLAPKSRRGFYTSWQMVGQLLAVLIGSSFCLLLSLSLPAEELYQYAWKIPFIFGLVILPIGWILRAQFQKQWAQPIVKAQIPKLGQELFKQKANLLRGFAFVAGCTASVYTLFSYMPTYAKLYLHLSFYEAYLGPVLGISIAVITIPLFGYCSDKLGHQRIQSLALGGYVVCAYPLLWLLNNNPCLSYLLLAEGILGLFIGAYLSVFTYMMVELFPKELRSTCLAISYNLAVLIFGGFAPLTITFLIERYKDPMIFTYYLMCALSISLLATLWPQKAWGLKQACHPREGGDPSL